MKAQNQRGMTYPEFFVVLTILAFLAIVFLPEVMHDFRSVGMKANMTTGELNIRQISYGLIQYMQDNNEQGPRAGYDCLDHSSDPTVFKKGQRNQCGGDGWQNVVAPYIKSESPVFVSPGDQSQVGEGPWGGGTGSDFNTTDGNFSLLYNDLLAHKMPAKSGGYAGPAYQDKHADGLALAAIKDPTQCLLICEGHGGWDKCSTKAPPLLVASDWTGSTDLQNKWHHDYTITGNYTGFISGIDYLDRVTIQIGLPFYNGGGNVAFVDGHQSFKLYSIRDGSPALCKSLPWTASMDPQQRNASKDSCNDPDNPVPAGWGGSNWF